jgi:branched-chain amino acid transport system permease protein
LTISKIRGFGADGILVRRVLLSILVVAAAAAAFLVNSPYVLQVLTAAAILALAAMSLNIPVGFAGQVTFGHVMMYATGAYAFAIAVNNWHLNFWASTAVAVVAAAAIGLTTGAPAFRLRGLPFSIVTFAEAGLVLVAVTNLSITGGVNGISVDRNSTPTGFIDVTTQPSLYLLTITAVVGFGALTRWLVFTRSGRATLAIRENEDLAEALGIRAINYKLGSYTLGCAGAGLAGALFAWDITYISPGNFSTMVTIGMFLALIFGGTATIVGPIIGAVIWSALPGLLQDVSPTLENVIAGSILILVMIFARGGIAGLVNNIVGWQPLRRWRHEGIVNEGMRHAQSLTIARGAIADSVPIKPPGIDGAMPQPERQTIFEASRVAKSFRGLSVLRDVSITVREGEIVGLIGPNGAGKTTLFNIATGWIKADSGVVRYKGTSLSGLSKATITRLGIVRTFQIPRLFPDLSTWENLEIASHLRRGQRREGSLNGGFSKLSTLEIAEHELRAFALTEYANVSASSLPLGIVRRLSVAMAAATGGRLLLADEPASGMHLAEKMELVATLRELRTNGWTILIVDHDMRFVMGLVDRVYVLDAGRMIAQGSPRVVAANEAVQAAYLGAKGATWSPS